MTYMSELQGPNSVKLVLLDWSVDTMMEDPFMNDCLAQDRLTFKTTLKATTILDQSMSQG